MCLISDRAVLERLYHSNVLGWVRARLGFVLVRATVLCLRGSRTRWRSLDFEDGAAIDWTLFLIVYCNSYYRVNWLSLLTFCLFLYKFCLCVWYIMI